MTQEGRGGPPKQATRADSPTAATDAGDAGDAGDNSGDLLREDDEGDGDLPFDRMQWPGPDGDDDEDDDRWGRRGPRRAAPVGDGGGAAADPPGIDL